VSIHGITCLTIEYAFTAWSLYPLGQARKTSKIRSSAFDGSAPLYEAWLQFSGKIKSKCYDPKRGVRVKTTEERIKYRKERVSRQI
jgi:hypothetical protein